MYELGNYAALRCADAVMMPQVKTSVSHDHVDAQDGRLLLLWKLSFLHQLGNTPAIISPVWSTARSILSGRPPSTSRDSGSPWLRLGCVWLGIFRFAPLNSRSWHPFPSSFLANIALLRHSVFYLLQTCEGGGPPTLRLPIPSFLHLSCLSRISFSTSK